MFGIVFRHELFENTPWIPLAFLVHDRKLQKCHNRLFEFIAEKIPALKSRKISFVMDREPALTRAVETYFPNMQVLHCWNHLKRDFNEELRKLCADKSENLHLLIRLEADGAKRKRLWSRLSKSNTKKGREGQGLFWPAHEERPSEVLRTVDHRAISFAVWSLFWYH